jgi:hypothetical protein
VRREGEKSEMNFLPLNFLKKEKTFDTLSFLFKLSIYLMKKIITSTSPESITISELPLSPIIGVIDPFNNKTFVIKTEYGNSNSYKLLSSDGVSTGNSYSNVSGNLQKVLSNPLFSYFLFESEKELFKWLSEE